MAEKRTCPSCGAEMPSDAPAGPCVACLLKAGLPDGKTVKESSPGGTIALDLPLTEKAGDRIGRYKLLQQIGEGGCGVVYMAEQQEPVKRRVALKVIKLGMDTKEVVARFEAERQALALMDHPNIAKVLDAGATENGRPYFVMELVKGIPITRYCDENKLDTTATAGSVHPGLPGDPARASEGDHSPGHQAVQHSGRRPRWGGRAQDH